MAEAADRELRAALAVAARNGLVCDDPEVVPHATNVLLHLAPAPVVARVQTATARVRDPELVIARAIDVTSYLASIGAPVAGPSKELPPGPHLEDGLCVSFWRWHDHDRSRLTEPAEAGRRLLEVHEALLDYPGALPDWDPIAETRTVLNGLDDGENVHFLVAAAGELADRVRDVDLPRQAVHGDAHLANLLCTPDGPLWNDWEITHRGPREWDLGSMVIRSRIPPFRDGDDGEQALLGYGASDPDLVQLHVELYGVFQSAWWLAFLQANPNPHLAEGVTERLDWWRHWLDQPMARTPRQPSGSRTPGGSGRRA